MPSRDWVAGDPGVQPAFAPGENLSWSAEEMPLVPDHLGGDVMNVSVLVAGLPSGPSKASSIERPRVTLRAPLPARRRFGFAAPLEGASSPRLAPVHAAQ